MFCGPRARLLVTAGPKSSLREFSRQSVRFKSEPSRRVDDFPYKHLNPRDTSDMSAAMERTDGLGLRAFFAQHRPLMPFGKPAAELNDFRWVRVVSPTTRFLPTDDKPVAAWVPEQIARQLGPFDRQEIMRKKTLDIPGRQGFSPSLNRNKQDRAPLSATEAQDLLKAKFPSLMRYLAEDGIGLTVLSVNLDGAPVDNSDSSGVEATSVRRKRKLKMNRHKYRKRLKEQRTKRRRLGK